MQSLIKLKNNLILFLSSSSTSQNQKAIFDNKKPINHITRDLSNLQIQKQKFSILNYPASISIATVSYTHLTLPTNREV